MVRVSVITPYYYGKIGWLNDCVNSILNQNLESVEHIIVNDGTDESINEILDIRDERVRVFRHRKNKGIPAARNTGIEHSNGDYIAFLDQDDYFKENRLKSQVEIFDREGSGVGVVYGDIIESDEHETRIRPEPLPEDPELRVKEIFLSNPVITTAALINSNCFRTHGLLDESLYGADDFEFWLRIAEDYEFKYLPKVMSYKRGHGDNASSKVNKLTDDRLNIIEKYSSKYSFIKDVRKKHAGILLRDARYSFENKDYQRFLSSILGAIKSAPAFSFAKITGEAFARIKT